MTEAHLPPDQIVPEYDSSSRVVRWLFRARIAAAAGLKAWRGGRVLDAGCGSGLLLETLAREVPAASLYGMDLNPRVGRLPITRACHFEQGDLGRLPFADGCFESVYCLDTLEHIEDLPPVLREIERVLEPSGELIVSIPMENAFYKLCRFILKGTTSMEEGPGAGRHYWDSHGLTGELAKVFDLERCIDLPVPGPLSLFQIVRLRRRAGSSPARPARVSIVIPVYDEEATVERIVERAGSAPVAGLEREVLVVDDGSTDGTPAILERLASPGVQVIRHVRNRGKGAALRTGFAHARGDVLLVQDADLEYSPDDYAALLDPIVRGESEIVYGSRFLGPHRQAHSSPAFYWGGQLVTRVANLLYRLRLTDEPTGYKVFRRHLLPRLDLRCEGFDFCAELTSRAGRLGLGIVEVPVSYHPRSAREGKKITWRDGVEAIAVLIRLRFTRR